MKLMLDVMITEDQVRSKADTRITGFTLIELLVVIAIVSLLSSVVLSSLSGARSRARDSNRIQQMRNIRTALEQFYNIHESYPCGTVRHKVQGGTYKTQSDPSWFHTNSKSDAFLDFDNPQGFTTCNGAPDYGLITEGLMSPIKDPGNNNFVYEVIDPTEPEALQSYILYFELESNEQKMPNDNGLSNCWYEVGPGVGKIEPSWTC